jgi:aryl-alcohol dehydrogenase-like predicted oxidoreductase
MVYAFSLIESMSLALYQFHPCDPSPAYHYPETNGVLDVCKGLDVALIAYSPLEQGILTGRYRGRGTSMPAHTRRREAKTSNSL